MSPSTFKLLKMQATGNDFLIADCTIMPPPHAGIRSEMAKAHCHRLHGFGADGFLILERSQRGIIWDFYNSDGSSAAMCGNAARAVGRYLLDQAKVPQTSFQASIGDVQARKLQGNEVEVEFLLPGMQKRGLPWHSAQFVDTGVPHAVLKMPAIDELPKLAMTAKDIKAKFGGNGINVTYFSDLSTSEIHAITHERGVEDFTLSCGTGALAAAHIHLDGSDGDCTVNVPGGVLHVTFKGKAAILRGEAKYIGWCLPIDGDRL